MKTSYEYTSACLPGKDACGFLFQNWDNKRGTALSKERRGTTCPCVGCQMCRIFNGVVFHAVGDDVRQPPVQQFAGAFILTSPLRPRWGNFLSERTAFTDFNDGGLSLNEARVLSGNRICFASPLRRLASSGYASRVKHSARYARPSLPLR